VLLVNIDGMTLSKGQKLCVRTVVSTLSAVISWFKKWLGWASNQWLHQRPNCWRCPKTFVRLIAFLCLASTVRLLASRTLFHRRRSRYAVLSVRSSCSASLPANRHGLPPELKQLTTRNQTRPLCDAARGLTSTWHRRLLWSIPTLQRFVNTRSGSARTCYARPFGVRNER
jgi:hypothetical protein